MCVPEVVRGGREGFGLRGAVKAARGERKAVGECDSGNFEGLWNASVMVVGHQPHERERVEYTSLPIFGFVTCSYRCNYNV